MFLLCAVMYLASFLTGALALAQMLGIGSGGAFSYQQQQFLPGPIGGFGGGSSYNYWPQMGGNMYGNGQNDPCWRVNCGPGRYCTPLSYGSFNSGPSYKCRRFQLNPNDIQIYDRPRVGKCYDELVYKVPAGALDDGRNRMGFPGMGMCVDQCQSRSQCGPGQICCTRGCGNICYTPETTVIDLVNTGAGNMYPGAGGPMGGIGGGGWMNPPNAGGVFGPFVGGSAPGLSLLQRTGSRNTRVAV